MSSIANVDGSSGDDVYKYLVVDSGPIIRLTGVSSLWRKAVHFYTVPAVVQEIRDAKARQHLEGLPFDLIQREASREGIQAVTEFARKTGDYNSLSSVDLQVLGLLYDLEREGCGDISHIRVTPKRMIGLGKIESLNNSVSAVIDEKDVIVEMEGNDVVEDIEKEDHSTAYEPRCDHFQPASETTKCEVENVGDVMMETMASQILGQRKSWANLVNPDATPLSAPTWTTEVTGSTALARAADHQAHCNDSSESTDDSSCGQFSDAEDDDDDGAFLDETTGQQSEMVGDDLENELQSDFPNLAASTTVPFEGEEEPDTTADKDHNAELIIEAERKLRSLQPISKSGKLYNSFTKYGDLMTPKPMLKVQSTLAAQIETPEPKAPVNVGEKPRDSQQSRIVGGMGFSGQGDDVEDDGEGWIVNAKDLSVMRSFGAFDPGRTLKDLNTAKVIVAPSQGPLLSQRAACTTTDFAMQNVILQMNLELLSVDGMKVRKLKNWVTRCGACYTVYTNSDNPGPLGKRLFCERCGSDVLQRIAASVDGKTGRLRLHLSKKYQYNLRGTKFSLPKPGSGNRFQGDLLLREDQLLMGAWSQKVKMKSGGKARDSAQSMFGKDIASNVGCHSSAVNIDDIRVGFGRRNPNAAKGRERRGKKKKSDDKACGLRRY